MVAARVALRLAATYELRHKGKPLVQAFLASQNLQRNVKGAVSAVWPVTNIAIEHDSGAVPGRRRRCPSAALTRALAIRLWRLSLRVWPLKLPGF